MGIIAWLFNTSLGRSVLLAGVITITLLSAWYFFADHYYDQGKADCEAAQLAAVNDANVEQAAKNEQSNDTSSEIAKEADKATEETNRTIDAASGETKEVIRYVYRDRPTTSPVALGSCAHPVDQRVQQRFDRAVDKANNP